MKVIVEYDPVTKCLETINGSPWSVAYLKYEPYIEVEDKHLVRDMIKQGYTSKELIQLKEAGVI